MPNAAILHPVLFESDFVFEEMLLVIIRIFSQMWITMGATFLHFPKVPWLFLFFFYFV